MTPAQFIPVGEITRDVFDLGDALPIRCVLAAPMTERVHVEILAIEIDALLGECAIAVKLSPVRAAGL